MITKKPTAKICQWHPIARLFSYVALFMMFLGVAHAANDVVGAVFVATNDPVANGVLMFQRHKDGTLTPVSGSPFLTGGQGTGTGVQLPPDPQGSQGSLIVDEKNKFLFVVNSGSNQVSVFKINKKKLTLVETVPSGGYFPNSLTIRNNVLYVLNSANTFNFCGFKVSDSGHLTPLNGMCCCCTLLPPLNEAAFIDSRQPLVTVVPGQIGFSPDGKHLIITRKEGITSSDPFSPLAGPGRIDVYALDKNGVVVDCNHPTVNINTRLPSGRFPFSFIFSEQGDLLVTEIFGSPSYDISPFGASAMSSYEILPNGELQVITGSLPNGQTATCWNARSGKFVYTANNLSNSISLYEVHSNGTLELLDPEAAILSNGAPGFPLDMVVSSDGKYLYQLSEGVEAAIYEYKINKENGSLTFIGKVSVGAPFAGQAGINIVDFKK